MEENKPKEAADLGFGTRITGRNQRLLNKSGAFNVERIGEKNWTPYQDLVEMPFKPFLWKVLVYYISVNLFFALVVSAFGVECLNGVKDEDAVRNFLHAWFFSVQTFTTVGYGSISPACISTNFLATIIALTGVLTFAIITGILFARFSKPQAQLAFSKNAIIAPYRCCKSLQFRIVNRRNNQLIDVEAKVNLSWVADDGKGGKRRQFARLPLELDKAMMLSLNWNIVHPIDEASPFWGKTAADLAEMEVEVIALIEAFDESFSQMVHTQYSYTDDEILWNVRFKLMYYPGEDGKTVLDLNLIDEVVGVW